MVQAFLEAAQQVGQPSTPLLVLADWLEENGDAARSHFLRLQVQAAALPRHDRHRRQLEERAVVILREHGETWLGPLKGLVRGWEFTGGRLEVVVPANVFLGAAMGAVLEGEVWAWVRQVRLEGVNDDVAATLAGSLRLAQITSLNLRYNSIGDLGALALARSPHLANVLALDLALNRICAGGAQALAESPYLTKLTYLDLWGNRISSQGAEALLSSGQLANLTYLDLERNHICVHEAQPFVASRQLPKLTFLNLRKNFLDEPVRAALRRWFGQAVEL
jgi:uncharacterized protein (TIGR02996 family)